MTEIIPHWHKPYEECDKHCPVHEDYIALVGPKVHVPYEYLKKIQEEWREYHKNQDWWRELDPDFLITGLAGEWAFSQLFDMPMDIDLTTGGDGGIDFRTPHYTIDVKTVKFRDKKPLLLREAGKNHGEILVLAVFYPNRNTIQFLGWAYDKDVVKGAPIDRGTGVINHVHRVDQLKPMSKLKELLKMYKVAVVGSRRFTDYDLMKQILNQQHDKIGMIISGGAKGADTLAQRYAKDNGIPMHIIYPEYEKYGKRAPLRRNVTIANLAEKMIAFGYPDSRGTRHVVDKMKQLNKPYVFIMYSGNGFGVETNQIDFKDQ